MHLYYIHQHFSPPGQYGNNRSLEFCRQFVKDGLNVTIITSSSNFNDVSFKKRQNIIVRYIEGIRVVIVKTSYSHFMNYSRRIFSFIHFTLLAYQFLKKSPAPDLLYISSTPLITGWIGLKMKKRYNIPYIFETVDLWPDVPIEMGIIKGAFIKKKLYDLEKNIYLKANKIITLSDDMTKMIIQKGIDKNKIFTIYNGTNTNVFYPSFSDISYKQYLGFSKDDFVLLYAGTIGRANGVDFLVKVASKIYELGYNKIKFLIIGEGNRKKDVVKYANKLKADNVFFKTKVPLNQLNKVMQIADAGIITFAPFKILETNSANKFFDYLAAGLPVLINYKGWQAQYLYQFECGFSTLPRDVQSFLNNVLYLYNNQYKKSFFGKNARWLAINYFDRINLVKKLEHILLRNDLN